MVSKLLVSLTLLVCAVLSVQAAIGPGRCPVVSVKDTFDVSKYVGAWYDIRSYFTLFQVGLNCSRANYTAMPNGQIRVNNTATAKDRHGNKTVVNVTGVAYAPNKSLPAKLVVQFDNQSNKTAPGDYWVIDTDYSNFAIVWACHNNPAGLFHNSFSWVLGRNPKGFSSDIEAQIDQILSKHNIDASLYETTVQTGCINY